MKNNHQEIYDNAEFYDIAFSFRDIPRECNFLKETYFKQNQKVAGAFLELCAGPSGHTIEMSLNGLEAVAIDLSDGMKNYALQKAVAREAKIVYELADIRNFKLDQKFDIAALLMGSASYLLTNEDLIQNLQNVARHLNPGGLYFFELPHPRETFNTGSLTITDWDSERNEVKVNFQWGTAEDTFDPITQVTDTTVIITAYKNGEKTVIKEKAKQRCFTATEFLALVRASGCFRIVEIFGSLDRNILFTNDNQAWRMVPVLQVIY